MISCPGVLTNMAAGLTGFSPAIMAVRSSKTYSSVMATDWLVPLENAIGEGSLVLAPGFS